jgi:DNA-directed RNA polymerase subunit alpha
MISLSDFNIKKVSDSATHAEFQIGPLPTGYGHTLGNILRRVLTSSVPGAAITAVKIDGVHHEYSTLEGVSQDILNIILALKNIVVLSKSAEPVTLNIDVKGKNGGIVEVTAGDFEKNSDIEVINPEYVITKLTSAKSKFSAQIVIEQGTGYMMPNEEVRHEVGMLPVDALFSPVKLVNYSVTPTRVGNETELDQLNLTVITNGAITPSDSLSFAANLINQMAQNFVVGTKDMISGRVNTEVAVKKEDDVAEDTQATAQPKLLVAELNLSTRLTNALLRSGFDDLRKLDGFTEEELANIRGMGEKSLDELLDILKKYNIKLI